MQLCAQALCLEQMYGGNIPKGAIFYIQDHRRDEIELTDDLRNRTREAAGAIRRMLADGVMPAAEYSAKCRLCSMIDDCMPKVQGEAKDYLSGLMASLKGEMP